MNFLIYKMTTPNNSIYIGQTNKTLHYRKLGHYRYLRKKLKENSKLNPMQRALLKYDKTELKWEVLEKGPSKKWADNKEKYYIQYFDTFRNGLNATKGGDGTLGKIPWNKGKKGCFSSDTLKKMRNAKLGKPSKTHTEETKRKLSEINKKLYKKLKHTPAGWNKGQKMSKTHYDNYLKTHWKGLFHAYEAVLIQPKGRNQKAIYKKGKYVKSFKFQKDCADYLKTSQGNIGACLRGQKLQIKGLILTYQEN